MLVSDNFMIDLIGLFIFSLCGLWLISWMRIRQATDRCEQLRRDLEAVKQVGTKMKRNCDRYRFEVEWKKVIEGKHSGTRLLNILKQWCRPESRFYGWILYSDGNWDASDHNVQRPDIPQHLPVCGNVIEKSKQPEFFDNLPPEVETLSLFQCDLDATDTSLMFLSELPDFASDSSEREAFVHLMQRTRCQRQEVPEPILNANHDVEVELAKEMLEIRALLDSEFQSPHEMMQGFLKKLAFLTGYQWASLYLNGPESETNHACPHFASGGMLESCNDLANWQRGEQVFVDELFDLCDSSVIITAETVLERNEEIPFRCGMVIPVSHEGETLGLLMLTHRETTLPRHEEAQLVEWASSFLLQTLQREISRADIAQQARRDALTNLANRGTFDQELARFLEQSELMQEPCSLLMLDVDNFKSFNDRYGHTVGDLVLKKVAAALQEITHELRVTDHALAARYGGEEFAMILPNVGHTGAMRIAEQIRQRISQLQVLTENEKLSVTISLGVATSDRQKFEAEELIKQADRGLYLAKESGRNCVCTHCTSDSLSV